MGGKTGAEHKMLICMPVRGRAFTAEHQACRGVRHQAVRPEHLVLVLVTDEADLDGDVMWRSSEARPWVSVGV